MSHLPERKLLVEDTGCAKTRHSLETFRDQLSAQVKAARKQPGTTASFLQMLRTRLRIVRQLLTKGESSTAGLARNVQIATRNAMSAIMRHLRPIGARIVLIG